MRVAQFVRQMVGTYIVILSLITGIWLFYQSGTKIFSTEINVLTNFRKSENTTNVSQPENLSKLSSRQTDLIRNIFKDGCLTVTKYNCPHVGKDIKLLIAVTSAPKHETKRNAIRKTWGNFKNEKKALIVFLVGLSVDEELSTKLQKEQDLHNDIIRGNFIDSYNNLTLKSILMLEWVKNHCSKALFLLKTDDDMFINVPLLLKLIAVSKFKQNAIYGQLRRHLHPERNTLSKYYVSRNDYRLPFYPDFTSGPAYLLPVELTEKLYNEAKNQNFFKLEDVFLTGMVAKKLKIKLNSELSEKVSIISVIFPLVIFFIGLWFWYQKQRNKYYKNIPSPPTVPFFGNALDFRSTTMILDTSLNYMKLYGGLVKVNIGPFIRFLLVADYDMIEFILSSTTLLTKSEDYKFLRRWLGTGLLIGDGPKWKKHRKILTPAFHFQILEQFVDVFDSCGDILIKKLKQEVDKDSVDIVPHITLCTLDIICESTMGTSINAQNNNESDYVHSVKEMCRIIIERSISPVQVYDLCYYLTRNYRIEKKAIKILHHKANTVIVQRMEKQKSKSAEDDNTDNFTTKKKKAFLDLLLEATVDGQPLSQEDLREEVDTFMFAGHDTTSTAINFALFCLANHPEVQQLAFEEQETIFEGNKSPNVSYADLQNMKYLELVVKETLRLYPPVPIIGRQPTEELVYKNTRIPKKETMLLFIFGIHRNPKYFDNPETFNPSRFENIGANKYPYAYIPFSAGPRNCIGQKFAMLEIKSVISKIIRTFELRPATPYHTLKLASETVLRSVNGVKISIKLR